MTDEVQEGGRTLNAVIIGSPNVNPGYVLVGNKNYPQIAQDYVKTFTVLKNLPADVFLGAHGAYCSLKDRDPMMKRGRPSRCDDPAGDKTYGAARAGTSQDERVRPNQ